MLLSNRLVREAQETARELEALRTALSEHEHLHHRSDATSRVLRQLISRHERRLISLHVL
jgi:hypothetical protein